MLQSNQRIIRHKDGLLNLAGALGNVSKARIGPRLAEIFEHLAADVEQRAALGALSD